MKNSKTCLLELLELSPATISKRELLELLELLDVSCETSLKNLQEFQDLFLARFEDTSPSSLPFSPLLFLKLNLFELEGLPDS